MSNDEKVLEALAQLQGSVSQIQSSVSKLEADVSELKQDVQFVRECTVRIENDYGKKLDSLFDGYLANHEIIARYDSRVSKLERDMERTSIELRYLRPAQ